MARKAATEAVSYLRVSGKSQIDGDGFPRQRAAVELYAKKNNIIITKEYAEEGVSGTLETADRPVLSDLVADLATDGKPKLILVEKSDRLARDLIVGELILREFRKLGIVVIAVESGTDLTAVDDENPSTKFIRQVLGAVAEFEKCSLVNKLKAARRRLREKNGRCEGVKPFGSKEGEAERLDRVRQLARKPRGGEPLSLRDIAAKLNAEGVASRSGKPWTHGTVAAVLKH